MDDVLTFILVAVCLFGTTLFMAMSREESRRIAEDRFVSAIERIAKRKR